jgi:hypothetical protein
LNRKQDWLTVLYGINALSCLVVAGLGAADRRWERSPLSFVLNVFNAIVWSAACLLHWKERSSGRQDGAE